MTAHEVHVPCVSHMEDNRVLTERLQVFDGTICIELETIDLLSTHFDFSHLPYLFKQKRHVKRLWPVGVLANLEDTENHVPKHGQMLALCRCFP